MKIFGGGAFLLVAGLLVVKFFPNEVAAFWRRLGAPPESALKKQSAERLAEMERNIAERKARQGADRIGKAPPAPDSLPVAGICEKDCDEKPVLWLGDVDPSCRMRQRWWQRVPGEWVNVKSEKRTVEIVKNGDNYMIRNTGPSFIDGKMETKNIPATLKDGTLQVKTGMGVSTLAVDKSSGNLTNGQAEYRRLD